MDLRTIYAPAVPYKEALALQLELREQRMAEKIPDTLLLLEHPPVVTLGKRGKSSDLLLSRELFTSRGVEIAEIDRGGQVTYHGPGQLVGYNNCQSLSSPAQAQAICPTAGRVGDSLP